MASYVLRWSIKTSLIDYISDVEGEIDVTPPATREDGDFVFPQRGETVMFDDHEVHAFGGAVTFMAHGGLLSIELSTPRVHLGATGGTLEIVQRDKSTLTVATLTMADDQAPGAQRWDARLDSAAVRLFGRTYPGGTELAPVILLEV